MRDHQRATAIDAIIAAGTADNTHRAHAGDLKYFWAWAREAMGLAEAYPVETAVIIRFITDHLTEMDHETEARLVAQGIKAACGPHSPATVERRLATLSYMHRRLNVENTVRNAEVRLVLSKAKAAAVKAGRVPGKKRAITRKLLEQMIDTFGHTLKDKRDKAILYFAFASGGRRRSEVAAAKFRDLDRVRGGYVYTLPHSKTDQQGKGHPVPVRGRAARVLAAWIDAAGIAGGYLFRQIHGGRVTDRPIDPRTVNRIVKDRVEMCGRDPRHYGAHSLRRGFVTECGRKGVPLRDTMQMSTHKTVAVAVAYHEEGEIFSNPAGNLLD